MSQKLNGPMLPAKSGEAKRLVVLLHGYGSDGNDLISLGPYWRDALPDTAFVAPNGPQPCDMSPMGYQWFPISFDNSGQARLEGSETARPVIMDFLTDLWAQSGVGPEQTVLGGFSQGAMLSLEVGLRLETPLAGILAFSGGMIAPENAAGFIRSRPPVCLIHGAVDEMVPASRSELARDALVAAGVSAELHISPHTAHSIAIDGLEFATAFLKRVLD